MRAKEVLTTAMELVGGDRKEAYGDVLLGLDRIALMWNALLTIAGKAPRQPINAHDVAQMMVCLKQARAYTGPLRIDNHIDAAGWSSVAGEAASRVSEAS
ncbi:hypothetical protein SAMN03159423_4834 [Bradyrhizobium sp. NFR13]|uniref:DUF6378 domain-containing protein n=1 Tax=Bradyrhizobium sp. NFR13 TaxID=1566285 RepID=UPI0008E79FEC|nr:DUF6378 domain-containing protein [Bradyrhizobium sp. NFR13]SFM00190.1 hypothetical protein SAMN03159423_4834 [Bradyrhizobium sp. NFR13]